MWHGTAGVGDGLVAARGLDCGAKTQKRRNEPLVTSALTGYRLPMTDDEVGELREAVRASGLLPVSAALGVNREAVLRVLAGVGVRAGTLALLRERLPLARALAGDSVPVGTEGGGA